MTFLQDLAGAAPAPAVQFLLGTAGRKLMQAGNGVQVQVIVQGSPDSQASVAAALQDSVSNGQLQAALRDAGAALAPKPTSYATHGPSAVWKIQKRNWMDEACTLENDGISLHGWF